MAGTNQNTKNINNLKSHRDDILKAEVGALLFNLGKTCIQVGNWKDYFKGCLNANTLPINSYKNYCPTYLESELTKISPDLKKFIFDDTKVKLPDGDDAKLKDFLCAANNDNKNTKEAIKKVLMRGCENINSGIDKGAPVETLSTLWISNAFGSFKSEVTGDSFDERRYCFFCRIDEFLRDKDFYKPGNADWDEIRKKIFKEVFFWYTYLLSDNRFPVNDVTLWDQVYMTASMFKAALAASYIDKNKFKSYIDNPVSVRWSILGIQYDKLGLAEKGLKPASIEWYRDASKEVDEEIKGTIETEYALGNEVYRDETGIYFIVPENLVGEKWNTFYRLGKDFKELEDRIKQIFSDKFEGEVYPAILLTEPSRGLMNLGALVESAKYNFLSAEYPEQFAELLKDDDRENDKEKIYGVCQVCGMRLACKEDGEDKDNLICNVCKERQGSRIDEWEKELQSYTIWTGELKDDNNRIALISLKFDLSKWLNGDLMNTLLIRKEDFWKYKEDIKNFIYLFLSESSLRDRYFDDVIAGLDKEISKLVNEIKNVSGQQKGEIGKKKGKLEKFKKQLENIRTNINEVVKLRWYDKSLNDTLKTKSYTNNFEKMFKDINNELNKIPEIYKPDMLKKISFFPEDLASDAYIGCKINGESFNDFIRQIFFGSIVGNEVEEWIRKSNLKCKIDWNKYAIDWQKLDNDDIEFLATMLLQFLLRKNPSPARLRRVWETTQSFFEDLERRILNVADMPERERYYWELDSNLNSNEVSKKDGEYEDGDVEFWKRGNKVYTISWIGNRKDDTKVFHPKYKNGNQSDKIDSLTLRVDDNNKSVRYKPYFTILEPTPVSWQFAIPARYVPALINNLEKEYLRNFGFVYGKLPLRVGVVIQHYKKPLYIGIKALRNLRMDGVKWDTLKRKIKVSDLISRSSLNFANCPQGNCDEYYSIYELESGKALYNFYVYSDNGGKAVLLSPLRDLNCKDTVYFYPNTFDFEFLDTNARRNDIYYDRRSAQRVSELKSNRPYDLYDFCYFEYFNLFFFGENNAESANKSSSQLQKIISLVYSKLEDWKGEDESLKEFLISAFVNVLGLNDEDRKNKFANLMGFDNFAQIEESKSSEFKKGLYMLIDAFEFWHTTLKK